MVVSFGCPLEQGLRVGLYRADVASDLDLDIGSGSRDRRSAATMPCSFGGSPTMVWLTAPRRREASGPSSASRASQLSLAGRAAHCFGSELLRHAPS